MINLYRWAEEPATQSVFGSAVLSKGDVLGKRVLITCERMWGENMPSHSCLPPGRYTLEPHEGHKYQNTFALVGDTVSHLPSAYRRRSACVVHRFLVGRSSEGCVSFGQSVLPDPSTGAPYSLEGTINSAVIAYLKGLAAEDRVIHIHGYGIPNPNRISPVVRG